MVDVSVPYLTDAAATTLEISWEEISVPVDYWRVLVRLHEEERKNGRVIQVPCRYFQSAVILFVCVLLLFILQTH